eukprot:SAG11_NODE_5642_length_1498_cov_19.848463_1_plen_198_part_00
MPCGSASPAGAYCTVGTTWATTRCLRVLNFSSASIQLGVVVGLRFAVRVWKQNSQRISGCATALPDSITSTLTRTSRRADEDGNDDLLASVWAHGVSPLQGCGTARGGLDSPCGDWLADALDGGATSMVECVHGFFLCQRFYVATSWWGGLPLMRVASTLSWASLAGCALCSQTMTALWDTRRTADRGDGVSCPTVP